MPTLRHQPKRGLPRLLDAREVAEHFGVSVRTIMRMVDAREFPKPIRMGRRVVRWDATVLNKFIAGGCRPLP